MRRDTVRNMYQQRIRNGYYSRNGYMSDPDPLAQRMSEMISDRMGQLNRFGRNGPVGHSVLPPPPPVPEDPINYP